MSDWPSLIKLRVVKKDDGLPVGKKIMLHVQVVSPQKNNYSLPSMLTDERGEITIKKEEIEDSLYKAMVESPMDYSCSLDECGKIRVQMEDVAALKKRVSRLIPLYPQEAQVLEKMMRETESTNICPTDVELNVAHNLSVPVALDPEPSKPRKVAAEIDDPIYQDAVNVVLRSGVASITDLRTRLRIGYARAARLLGLMQERGIVGPSSNDKHHVIEEGAVEKGE